MKTNLDVIRSVDKDLLANLLYYIYMAKENNDEILMDICKSQESIKEWLDLDCMK